MNERSDQNNAPLLLWERVTLLLEKAGKQSTFLTRVEDIKRNSYVLEKPVRQSGELDLAKGDIVEVSYNRQDAVYSFKASILDLFDNDIKSVAIDKVGETHRSQRRKYVRLDISEKITFREMDIAAATPANLGAENNGRLLNISAGGVLFESPVKFKTESILVMSFSLKGRFKLSNVLAVIKRCEGSRSKGFLVGAEFLTRKNLADYGLEKLEDFAPWGIGTFDDNLQDVVVKFIYAQQVELRKKGLLQQ